MSLQKSELAQQIKQEARRLGFDLVGVTSADPPPHIDVFQRWLDADRHGEMGYLAKESAVRRRANPLEILPECKSVLVIAMNYLSNKPVAKPMIPQIAAYALGEDYHDVIAWRLEELMRYITRLVGFSVPHRIYSDTGPLLERELAQRSGLGWIGKNTCLIHPQIGSYLFLGEILLDLELEIDAPFEKDLCGSCTRCVDACPTGCILPDRTLDARRCISYLTIELKAAIPPDLRSLIGDWIFGCDICQQVCPWNIRFAQIASEPAFQPLPFLKELSITDVLELTQEDFHKHFRMSPFKRAKWAGILRNTTIAAGNHGGTEVVPPLANLLKDHPDPMVRSHAAWALGKIGGVNVKTILKNAMEVENERIVIEEIVQAIQTIEKSSGLNVISIGYGK
ncbi:MAG: tRNA epoxyqueuosine(34) reductase QueG [Chloroflexi bacterium RBG_16_48_8]|nr:MAG: tRNA epoxyqueuosine(34) reductase QueG [Chloroflexi bacterium RBG_16_48_8]